MGSLGIGAIMNMNNPGISVAFSHLNIGSVDLHSQGGFGLMRFWSCIVRRYSSLCFSALPAQEKSLADAAVNLAWKLWLCVCSSGHSSDWVSKLYVLSCACTSSGSLNCAFTFVGRWRLFVELKVVFGSFAINHPLNPTSEMLLSFFPPVCTLWLRFMLLRFRCKSADTRMLMQGTTLTQQNWLPTVLQSSPTIHWALPLSFCCGDDRVGVNSLLSPGFYWSATEEPSLAVPLDASCCPWITGVTVLPGTAWHERRAVMCVNGWTYMGFFLT